jgi:DNA-binding MarR family transcriptional regulator
MEDLIGRFKTYLLQALELNVPLSKPKKTGSLPFFLLNAYDIHQVSLLEKDFIVLVAKHGEELTPATVKKHVDMVNSKLGMRSIFVDASISSFNRKRLIEYKVPFVIPGNQMYLPDLGVDLREHFSKRISKPVVFGPSTQAVILFALTSPLIGPVNPTQLADKLGYSRMAMTRSITEIESAELASVTIAGRERLVHFDKSRRDLWEKALPHMKSPVKKHVWLNKIDDLPLCRAGLSALAEYSMLAHPKMPEYAVAEKDWKTIQRKHSGDIAAHKDEAACKLELWSYSPLLFSKDGIVDRFSLYLSLRTVEDERVESALETMMEDVPW